MSRVATLRASGRRLQAEVVMGMADNGSTVTVKVDLDRVGDVDEAMVPLENLVKRIAEERTAQAKDRAAIQAGIDAALPKAIEREKERLSHSTRQQVDDAVAKERRQTTEAINANRQMARNMQDLEHHNSSLSRQLQEAREQVDRLQAQAVGE